MDRSTAAMADLMALKQLFRSHSVEQIREVYIAHGRDVQKAANALLAETPRVSAPSN